MRTPDEPFTFTADNDQCIALLTDADLLDRFFAEHKIDGTLIRATLETPDALATFLQLNSQFAKKGVPITHVLIDPGHPSKRARCYPILEFARHVLASE